MPHSQSHGITKTFFLLAHASPCAFSCMPRRACTTSSTAFPYNSAIVKTAFQETIYIFLCKYIENLATQPIMRKTTPSSFRRFLPFHRGADMHMMPTLRTIFVFPSCETKASPKVRDYDFTPFIIRVNPKSEKVCLK